MEIQKRWHYRESVVRSVNVRPRPWGPPPYPGPRKTTKTLFRTGLTEWPPPPYSEKLKTSEPKIEENCGWPTETLTSLAEKPENSLAFPGQCSPYFTVPRPQGPLTLHPEFFCVFLPFLHRKFDRPIE